MVRIAIKLEPITQSRYSHISTLNISIFPGYGFTVIGSIPNTIASETAQHYISISEVSWYIQGITIWADVQENRNPSFDLELHASELLNSGLQIKIGIPTENIEPQVLPFPPGSIPDIGTRLHIGLDQLISRWNTRRTQNIQLFQQLQSGELGAILDRQDHIPLRAHQRATSDIPSRQDRIRNAEQQLNEEREEHLRDSDLF